MGTMETMETEVKTKGQSSPNEVKGLSDWIVTIEYKNKDLETVVEKEYDLSTYVDMLHLELMRDIVEIEEAFYYFTDNKRKTDWPPEVMDRFKKIRHRILDQANSIKRLPHTLTHNGVSADQISIAEYIRREES